VTGSRQAAIVGLGMTELGRVYGRTTTQFAAQAVRTALDDAGIKKEEVDGLLVNSGVTRGIDVRLQDQLGLHPLRLLNQMNAMGATAATMVQHAVMAVEKGIANVVVCVFADAPLVPRGTATDAYGQARGGVGIEGLGAVYGMTGAPPMYAMAARRHMELYGTTNDHLGAVAVTQRRWATMNPAAQMREPLTLEEYHSSRWIAEPFHLYDCCLVSNGAIAVVVAGIDRAADGAQPPVRVIGYGQGHPGNTMERGSDHGIHTGASVSGRTALGMAGIGIEDVDVCEIYDCFTYTVLVTLEDYGFCAKGEGGPWAASGVLGPGGALPTNTGGGELSAYYMWGMTPISEGIIQARGQGGQRQVPAAEVILVCGNGGILDTHATLLLSGRS